MSVEKKNKEKFERIPGSRTDERLRKLSYNKDGKGSNFERTESSKLGLKKGFDTIVKRQLKTEKKIVIDTKYDMTRQKTEPHTFNKSLYDKEKPHQTLQLASNYTKANSEQQTPRHIKETSYKTKQTASKSQSQLPIQKTSYTRISQQ